MSPASTRSVSSGACALSAAAITLALGAGARRLPARLTSSLERTNFQGSTVSLAEGLAVIGGVLTASAFTSRPAHTAALSVIGVLGAADDILEPLLAARSGRRTVKGLRGHLGALRHGRLTTGAAKALAIPVASLALTSHHPRLADRGIDTVMIAGSANLINLLDLRPGRALKATAGLAGAVLLSSAATGCCPAKIGLARRGALQHSAAQHGAAPTGAEIGSVPLLSGVLATVLAAAPSDLAERGMLGDAGANILGASVGAAASRILPRPVRVGTAIGMCALTIASERISFSAVIRDTPVLAAIDSWGRAR